ncbi:MAG: SRPBCC family protein, partial [Ekhidna sp.]|nr:SRPBCC family protein [Ekhidna sp.]
REEVKVFNPNQQLSYEVIEGFPGFIKQGVNNWYLEVISANQTKVTMHFVGETQGVMGLLMGPMMKLNLAKGLGGALKDFKFFVENGMPSSEKVKDNQKKAAKLQVAA